MDRSAEVIKFFNNSGQYLSNRYGIRLRTEIIAEITAGMTFRRTLDIGCGDGSLSLPFCKSAEEMVFMDISPAMLRIASENVPVACRSKCTFIEGDIVKSKLNAGLKFDLILAVGLLAHVSSVPDTLQKISEHLTDDGRAIIQFTDNARFFSKMNLWIKRFSNPYPVNKITQRFIDQLLIANSMHAVRRERYALVLPGFGRLGNTNLYRWNRMTRSNILLNRISTDVIVLAKRESNLAP